MVHYKKKYLFITQFLFNRPKLFFHFFFILQQQYPFAFLSVIKIKYLTILIPSCNFTKLMNSYGKISNNQKEKFGKFLTALLAPY